MNYMQALKKIESTRKKAKEISGIKIRNAEEQKRREEMKKKKKEQTDKLLATYKSMNGKIREGINHTKMQLLNQKKMKTHLIKTEEEVSNY